MSRASLFRTAIALSIAALLAMAIRAPLAITLILLGAAMLATLFSIAPLRSRAKGLAQRAARTFQKRDFDRSGSGTATPNTPMAAAAPSFAIPVEPNVKKIQIKFLARAPLSDRGAIFVANFYDTDGNHVRPDECNWKWSKAANGYYQYAPESDAERFTPLPDITVPGVPLTLTITVRHWPLWDHEKYDYVREIIHTQSVAPSGAGPVARLTRTATRAQTRATTSQGAP